MQSSERSDSIWRDDAGVVLPYMAIMLIAIVGLAALAIDASRLMSVQTELQGAADALALAGAAELDRRPDSIVRAQAAIAGLLSNPLKELGDGQTASAAEIDFLRSLPPNDDLPITTSNFTDDPALAAYVRVTVKPASILTLFPVSRLSGTSTMRIGADAVAGYDQIICNATPLYVCNPFEAPGMTYLQATQALFAASNDTGSRSHLIRLAGTQTGAGGYGFGTMGYIAADTGSLPASGCGPGAGFGIPQALAASDVRACFRLSRVDLLSSQDSIAMDGLNTRFDIYRRAFAGCRIYAPDKNVRKGFVTAGNVDWCNATPSGPNWPMSMAQNTPLPVDRNMIGANGAFNTNVAIGDGVWNCAAYWSIAHAVGPGRDLPPPGCNAAATISRYSVYKYEMNFLTDHSLFSETGGPRCAPPGEDNRRVVVAAIVNCGSSPVPVHADAQDIPAAAFGRFFLALPAASGTSGNPYAEFLGVVKRSDGLSKDLVQLYR